MSRSFAAVAVSLCLLFACTSESSPGTAASGGSVGNPGASGGSSAGMGTGGANGTGGAGVSSGGATATGGAVAIGSGGAQQAGTGGGASGGRGGTTAASGGAAQGGATGGGGNTGGNPGAAGASAGDPGSEGDGDFTIGPGFTAAPELSVKAGVPRGATYMFSMNSTSSAFYKGTDSTLSSPKSFTRNVLVYIPKQYVDGTPAPFIVSQDLQYGYQTDIMNALDTLINAKSVPALVVVFVDNGGGDSYGSERGLEYDTVSDRYQRFVDAEVLPAVTSNANIKKAYPNFKLTTDPEGRGTYGCSSGAAAAFTMGWFNPGAYRRLITYSGTFVDQQDTDAAEEKTYPNGAWEYHQRLIAEAERKPLRVFLECGENDNGATNTEASHHNWVMANQRMAAALKAKGYHYRFVYAKGANHCDGAVRKQTLPDTLRWMWRGYPQ